MYVCIYVYLSFEPRGCHNTSGKSGEIGEQGILYLYLLFVEEIRVQVQVKHTCVCIGMQFLHARDVKSLRS